MFGDFTEALKTVVPKKATGKPHSLWVAFARYYEDNEDLDSARDILERATKVEFRSMEDLSNVWCEWVEMELRHDEFQNALQVLHKATFVSDKTARAFLGKEKELAGLPVSQRVWKSTKLWSMYADLEESLGTLESTQAVARRVPAAQRRPRPVPEGVSVRRATPRPEECNE